MLSEVSRGYVYLIENNGLEEESQFGNRCVKVPGFPQFGLFPVQRCVIWITTRRDRNNQ